MCLKLDPLFLELSNAMKRDDEVRRIRNRELHPNTNLVLSVDMLTGEGKVFVEQFILTSNGITRSSYICLFSGKDPVEVWNQWKKWTS